MSNTIYLFQPQHEIYVGGEINYWIPYSIGCLCSYAQQYKWVQDNFKIGELFFKRESKQYILDTLDNPAIVGFSCYTWNEAYCLGMAKVIKDKWPDCHILFGGAQTSTRHLEEYFVDTIVQAEGELSFVDILEKFYQNKSIPEIYQKSRLTDLDIPSPYLTGVFDHLMEKYPEYKWATTIETNRGCPYACTFCDWGGITYSKIKKFGLERIQAELRWIEKHPIVFLVGGDANFGIFKERDLEIAKLIRETADNGIIDAVNLQYSKNNTGTVFEIGKVIGPYNRGITVSVQSMNEPTLKAIKRTNLDINDMKQMMELSEKYDVNTYTEVILGLPLETLETWKDGMCELLRLGQHQAIDLSIAELLENAELNTQISRELYGIEEIRVEQYHSMIKDQEFPETAKIVCGTNTMSTAEMVEAYLYAWMIIHIHVNGYCQLYARYLYNIHGVDYSEFYDKMFDLLQKDSKFKEHYNGLYRTLDTYLREGILIDDENLNEKGDSFHFASYRFCYENKEILFSLGKQVFLSFTSDIENIESLQRLFIYDDNQNLPIEINSDIDIKNWQLSPTKYKFYTLKDNLPQFKNMKKIDFWALRKKSLLRNKVIIDENI